MINKYILILLLAFSGSAYADSYLCIAEAGGGVRKHKQSKKVEGKIWIADHKWLVTSTVVSDSETRWSVKRFGDETNYFLLCKEDIYIKDIVCSQGAGDGRIESFRLYRQGFGNAWDAGEYIALTVGSDTKIRDFVFETGRCTEF